MKQTRLEDCYDIDVPSQEEACPMCDFLSYEICDEQFRRWHRTVYQSNSSCWTPTGASKTDVVIGRCAQINVDEANMFTIGGLAMFAVSLLLFCCTAIICCKHRRLQHDYITMFRNRNREMNAYNVPFADQDQEPDVFGDDLDEDFNIAATARNDEDQL
uniref:Uncharacterized protein n=1 Tax=Eutreptiella gymnastica TaxID=73025 RepID=A0A7S1HZV7_9EUGL